MGPDRRATVSPRRASSTIMTNLMRATFAGVALLLTPPAMPAQIPLDTALARRYFQEAALLAARDGGALWGRSIAGPLLFVDPASRTLLSEVADSAGLLSPHGSLFTARLPDREPIANTAFTWGGRTWAMLIWPAAASDSLARQVLFAHELWHRIQRDLGLPAGMPSNPHLGTADGRLWLRLEARALDAALQAGGARRTRALADALAFRRARRERFPEAAANERALELTEGLAEYTGVMLAGESAELRRGLARRRLAILDTTESLERNFAYRTVPAWGLLLDELGVEWRRELSPALDLGDRVARRLGGSAGGGSPRTRAAGYGYAALRRAEDRRAAARVERLALLDRRFRSGPVLELPLGQIQISFDPGKVETLEGFGTVYGMLRLSDRWGVLVCDGSGGLIASDYHRAVVPAPADTAGRRLTGPGWVLELLPGWRLVPGTRPGDWTISQAP
jgi:hypothetical protein